jgi:hypothetical protein
VRDFLAKFISNSDKLPSSDTRSVASIVVSLWTRSTDFTARPDSLHFVTGISTLVKAVVDDIGITAIMSYSPIGSLMTTTGRSLLPLPSTYGNLAVYDSVWLWTCH